MKYFFIPTLLFLGANAFFSSCKKSPAPDPVEPAERVFYDWPTFVMGADLSYVNQVQDYGGVYRDSGELRDPFRIFRDHGANTVRVRLWHAPSWQAALNDGRLYNDLRDVEKTIQRAKARDMAVNLDLHFSDTWADPGKQETPAAWAGLPLPTLRDSVYRYTLEILNYLKSRDLTPEMIQIGNETNQGMLFPAGRVANDDWSAFASLLNSGIRAVRDFSQSSAVKPQIILHVAQLQHADYFADNLTAAGVIDFDILGISHYYVYTTINDLSDIADKIRALKTTYGKKVMIVETAYPWTSENADSYTNIFSGTTSYGGYTISKTGQLNYMRDLTQAVISGGGSGIMYWEPAWISSDLKDPFGTGSSWENNAFFDFSGNALPVFGFMTHGYKF